MDRMLTVILLFFAGLLVWSWMPHTKGSLSNQAVQQYESVSIFYERGDGSPRSLTIPARSYRKHTVWGWSIGFIGSCTLKVYDQNNMVVYEDHPWFYRGYKMNAAQ